LCSRSPSAARNRHFRAFPTRRSSDLMRHGRVFGSPTGKPDLAYYFEYEFADMDAFRRAGDGLQKAAEDAQQMGVEFRVYFAEIEDRKSTRLNSSHRTISYAVFGLKKK